jgi:integrase
MTTDKHRYRSLCRVERGACRLSQDGAQDGVRLAGLTGRVTPHTFRHTAATWLMQNGVSMWRAAGFLGMSVETLDRVYGHHHPDYLSDAAEAIGRKPNRNQALVVPLVGAAGARKNVK